MKLEIIIVICLGLALMYAAATIPGHTVIGATYCPWCH
jgi:hypothetical protein